MTEYRELWEQDGPLPCEAGHIYENFEKQGTLTRRLLLPFTQGIDTLAITSALELAQHINATLVSLSLLPLPGARGKGPRWEGIQASKDFLEFVIRKARRSNIPVERIELQTHNVVGSIRALAREMECEGIILVVRRGDGLLLANQEVKHLLEDNSIPLYVVSLPDKGGLFSLFRHWIKSE